MPHIISSLPHLGHDTFGSITKGVQDLFPWSGATYPSLSLLTGGNGVNTNDIPTMFNQQGADIASNLPRPRTPEEIQRANLAAQGGMSEEEAMELFMSFDPDAAEAFAQEQEYRALAA